VKQIYSRDFEYKGQGDAGNYFEVRCPECHELIRVAAMPWWDTHCKCGYNWQVIARGEKDENQDRE